MDNKKKYNELVGKIKKAYLYTQTDSMKAVLEDILPELRESEDEKIRKEIISALKYANHKGVYDKHLAWLEKQKEFVSADFDDVWKTTDCDELTAPLEKYSKDAIKKMCHAWYDKGIEIERKSCLKKQGEQKPFNYENANIQQKDFAPKEEVDNFNKVEDKQTLNIIEKGKWYVCDTPRYADFALGKAYYCPKNGMLKPNENEMARYVAKDCFHLWTIQDAKDGDVLTSGQVVFIFKMIHGVWLNCYCSLHNDGSFIADSYDLLTDKYFGEVYPATKEQHDLLFQKMKDNGYEWNADKKELIIEEFGIYI